MFRELQTSEAQVCATAETMETPKPGGGGTWYIRPTGMCRFSGYRFRLFFLEQGIKRRQIFWSRLSKHSGQNMSKEEILLQRVII